MDKYNMPFDMWKWEYQDWQTITKEELHALIGNPLGLTEAQYEEIVSGKDGQNGD